MGLEFCVFGSTEAHRDGVGLAIGAATPRRLLTILLLHAGGRVRTDELIETLWNGRPPRTAHGALQVHVSHIRSALAARADQRKDVISTEPDGYALRVLPEQIDVHRYERLVREASGAVGQDPRQALERLLESADLRERGAPWADVADEPWAAAEREHIAELQRQADEVWAEAQLALGRSAVVVDRLQTAARAEPLRERRWEQLILALYRADRQADALGAYLEAASVLRDQLGVDPGPRLRSTYQAILHHAPELDATAPMPAERGSPRRTMPELFGRETDTAATIDSLSDAAVVTLTGVGGVGKSRLAEEVTRRVAGSYRHGVAIADLAHATSPGLVVPIVESALGLRADGEHFDTPPLVPLRAFLRQRSLLLVLDNCEPVAGEAADLILGLTATAPGLRVLATSRVPLGVPAERVLALGPLHLPAADAVAEDVMASPSVRHFVAASGGSVSSDDASEIQAIAAICRFTEGIPLAVEVAASVARSLPVADVAELLRDGIRLRAPVEGRHTSMFATLEWSYSLLDETERSLLRRLSVFAAGFTLPSASAVAGGERSSHMGGALARLVSSSLVDVADGAGPRYRLLDTVRELAARKLSAHGETEQAEDALATHLTQLAWAVRPTGLGPAVGDALSRLDGEHDNVRATLARLLQTGRLERAMELAAAMSEYWFERGHWGEGARWLDRVLEAAGPQPTVLKARCVVARARAASSFSAMAGHVDHLNAAVGTLTAVKGAEPADRFVALVTYAIAAGWRGHAEAALASLDEADGLARAMGSVWAATVAEGFRSLGRALAGAVQPARDAQRTIAARFLDLGDVGSAGRHLMYAATLSQTLGDSVGARTDSLRCAKLCRIAGNAGTAAHGLLTLAQLAAEELWEDAAQRYSDCVAEFERIGDARCAAISQLGLACLAVESGDTQGARCWLSQCVPTLVETDHRQLAVALAQSAVVVAAEQRHDEANTLLGAADGLQRGFGAPLGVLDRRRLERASATVAAAIGDGILGHFRRGQEAALDEVLALVPR